MATLSSILAWKTPWTEEEPGRLVHRVTVRHDFTFTFLIEWVDFSPSHTHAGCLPPMPEIRGL